MTPRRTRPTPRQVRQALALIPPREPPAKREQLRASEARDEAREETEDA